MNVIWSRFLRSAYRRDPISSFVITVGVVDAAIGGLGAQWSLMTVGLGTMGIAIAYRWRQQYRQRASDLPSRAPIHVLPPYTAGSKLPALSMAQKKSSGKRH